jgi:hypothetical protein
VQSSQFRIALKNNALDRAIAFCTEAALTFEKVSDYTSAAAHWEKASGLEETNPEPIQGMARCYEALNDTVQVSVANSFRLSCRKFLIRNRSFFWPHAYKFKLVFVKYRPFFGAGNVPQAPFGPIPSLSFSGLIVTFAGYFGLFSSTFAIK